jgi:hypothetical protein
MRRQAVPGAQQAQLLSAPHRFLPPQAWNCGTLGALGAQAPAEASSSRQSVGARKFRRAADSRAAAPSPSLPTPWRILSTWAATRRAAWSGELHVCAARLQEQQGRCGSLAALTVMGALQVQTLSSCLVQVVPSLQQVFLKGPALGR